MPNWKTDIKERLADDKPLRLNLGDFMGEKRVPWGAKAKPGESLAENTTDYEHPADKEESLAQAIHSQRKGMLR